MICGGNDKIMREYAGKGGRNRNKGEESRAEN
jgi:hypothetical protein